MRTKEEEFGFRMQDEAFFKWYHTRPEVVRLQIREYPYNWYKVKSGAPYEITCPGTIVFIISYTERGEVCVGIEPKHITVSALQHMRNLCEKFGTDITPVLKQGTKAYINPIWLEPIDYPEE